MGDETEASGQLTAAPSVRYVKKTNAAPAPSAPAQSDQPAPQTAASAPAAAPNLNVYQSLGLLTPVHSQTPTATPTTATTPSAAAQGATLPPGGIFSSLGANRSAVNLSLAQQAAIQNAVAKSQAQQTAMANGTVQAPQGASQTSVSTTDLAGNYTATLPAIDAAPMDLANQAQPSKVPMAVGGGAAVLTALVALWR
jgi:hypothetical protein